MLLAFDLDKTIVTERHQLPAEIAAAIAAARDAGHLVTVLTGRPHSSALPFLEQLAIREPHSVNHGALVLGADGAVLRRTRLAPQVVGELLERYGERRQVEFCCVVDDSLFVNDPRDPRWAWAHTQSREVHRYQRGMTLHADKIVFGGNGSSRDLYQEIRRAHPEFVTYFWNEGYVEVTGPESDKGAALALIAQTLGVPREETIAFGDGPNDVTMLAWAGHAVAVGDSATGELLAVADERIAAPEEGGVARWLEERLL